MDHILTARQAAWKTLSAADIARHDTAEVLGRYLDRTDRGGQAADIVWGVVRLRGTIDRVLRKCATLDPSRVKESHWNLLRMGVYELVYCPRTAEYAILNETAELAAKTGSRKTVGFINAVLRNVLRAIESRRSLLSVADITRLVPQDESGGCLFKEDLLPDPAQQPEQYLHLAYSMPPALVGTWLQCYGFDIAKEICIASNRNPSIIAQANTLRKTAEQVAHELGQESIEVQRVHRDAMSVRGGKLNSTRAYLDGLFYVQDRTAAQTIALLSPQPGWTVLDLCSAPGGKAAAMALRMRDQGTILASDIDAERLKRVRENTQRLGLQCIEIVPAERVEAAARKQERLDAIVLDVPCSNTGVLARRVEARWRWSQSQSDKLVQMQRQLLEKAASLARAGTRILYSTCSIQPEENEKQVEWFLQRHHNLKLEKQKLTFPATETPEQLDHDGGFAAVLTQDSA